MSHLHPLADKLLTTIHSNRHGRKLQRPAHLQSSCKPLLLLLAWIRRRPSLHACTGCLSGAQLGLVCRGCTHHPGQIIDTCWAVPTAAQGSPWPPHPRRPRGGASAPGCVPGCWPRAACPTAWFLSTRRARSRLMRGARAKHHGIESPVCEDRTVPQGRARPGGEHGVGI